MRLLIFFILLSLNSFAQIKYSLNCDTANICKYYGYSEKFRFDSYNFCNNFYNSRSYIYKNYKLKPECSQNNTYHYIGQNLDSININSCKRLSLHKDINDTLLHILPKNIKLKKLKNLQVLEICDFTYSSNSRFTNLAWIYDCKKLFYIDTPLFFYDEKKLRNLKNLRWIQGSSITPLSILHNEFPVLYFHNVSLELQQYVSIAKIYKLLKENKINKKDIYFTQFGVSNPNIFVFNIIDTSKIGIIPSQFESFLNIPFNGSFERNFLDENLTTDLPNKMVSGTYCKGLPDGEWKFWNRNGELSSNYFYKKGMPVGIWLCGPGLYYNFKLHQKIGSTKKQIELSSTYYSLFDNYLDKYLGSNYDFKDKYEEFVSFSQFWSEDKRYYIVNPNFDTLSNKITIVIKRDNYNNRFGARFEFFTKPQNYNPDFCYADSVYTKKKFLKKILEFDRNHKDYKVVFSPVIVSDNPHPYKIKGTRMEQYLYNCEKMIVVTVKVIDVQEIK